MTVAASKLGLDHADAINNARERALAIECLIDAVATSMGGDRDATALRGVEALAAALGDQLAAIGEAAAKAVASS